MNSAQPDCSIIICTRGRNVSLLKTLNAFRSVAIPAGWLVELIVADNDGDAGAHDLVASLRIPSIHLYYLHVPKPGKSHALNLAIAVARGRVMLFTDDDVEPADSWLLRMAEPMLHGKCDAVAGRIELAPHLERPWFGVMHRTWLAEVADPAQGELVLVGASMGIHRRVFEVIGHFDEALGPGASGFGEETLFGMRLEAAGFSISPVVDTFVVHHPAESRLLRSEWLLAALRLGETSAYIMHHWEHASLVLPRLRAFFLRAKLRARTLHSHTTDEEVEGCPEWEMSYHVQIARLDKYAEEACKPRNY